MEARELIAEIWGKVSRDFDEIAYLEAKVDPHRHRLTRIMERGKPCNYRYYAGGRNRHGWAVRYCYATNRNAAGYYLAWREVEAPTKSKSKVRMRRDTWSANPLRKDAAEWCRRMARVGRSQGGGA